MNYTPNDLQNIVFKKSVLGGYSEDMVNEVLDKVIEDYSFYIRENIELKDKISTLNEGMHHYKSIEESLQNTLIVAQKTGEDIKRNAYDKAENITKEAEIKAQRIIDDANNEVIKIRHEFDQVRKNLHIYKSKSESLLHSQMEVLKLITYEKEETMATMT